MGQINYLLDTNILSEPARKQPNINVMQRLAQYDGQYVTAAIVWHELQYGCELLAESKRKEELQSYLLTLKNAGLIILEYDQLAAEWYAKQRAILKTQGKIPAYADGEIASVASVNNLTLVTRNTDDFSDFKSLALDNWFE
ncbi:MAG: type II toxin-antitoxin system VapC family toxin [Methylococcaceae bacterium]|nr:type II toxin-antitoxin system VapC family toxin [Methylococcaceae bacterium]